MRRRLLILGLLLLLGAATSYVTGLWCAYRLNVRNWIPDSEGWSSDARPCWYALTYSGHGLRWVEAWPVFDEKTFLGQRFFDQLAGYGYFPKTLNLEPWEAVYRIPPKGENDADHIRIVEQYGWPAISLGRVFSWDVRDELAKRESHQIYQGDGIYTPSDYDWITNTRDGRPHQNLAATSSVFLSPVWPGFLLNSLIIAACWLALWLVWRVFQLCTRQWSRRRRMVTIAMCLIGACAANLGIAWGGSLVVDLDVSRSSTGFFTSIPGFDEGWGRGQSSNGHWIVRRHSTVFGTRISSSYYSQTPTGSYILPQTPAVTLIPLWADDRIVPKYDHVYVFDAWGWPLRSMRGGMNVLSGKLLNAIAVGPKTVAGALSDKRIPLQPIWLGAIGDVVLYFVALLVAVSVAMSRPFSLRRRLRLHRGQCPRCAYPIGVSPVCTECGCELRGMSAQQDRGTGVASTTASRPGGAA